MFLLMYLLGFIPSWWHLARLRAWGDAKQFGQSKPDGGDYGFAIFAAFFGALVWPLFIPALFIFNLIGGSKGVVGAFDIIFPKPMARAEKKEIKMRAKQKEINESRAIVNARERECGLPLSTWSD